MAASFLVPSVKLFRSEVTISLGNPESLTLSTSPFRIDRAAVMPLLQQYPHALEAWEKAHDDFKQLFIRIE